MARPTKEPAADLVPASIGPVDASAVRVVAHYWPVHFAAVDPTKCELFDAGDTHVASIAWAWTVEDLGRDELGQRRHAWQSGTLGTPLMCRTRCEEVARARGFELRWDGTVGEGRKLTAPELADEGSRAR